MKRKFIGFFTAVTALALIAALCVALVACDPDGKKGGGDDAGGDAIFTEGVTLAELTEKLNAADSLILNLVLTLTSSNETVINDLEHRLDGKSFALRLYTDDEPAYYEYDYTSDGYDYSAYIHEGVSIDISKSLSRYGGTQLFAAKMIESAKSDALSCMKEVDGKIVFNEKNALIDSEDYVEGSGYVKLNGDCLEYGYKEIEEYDGETTVYDYVVTLSHVNAYSFEVVPELKEAEKTATWVDYVSYNGVTYRKAVDEATGEEYYYVSSNSDGVAPETTINTLPVKGRR